MFVVKSVSQICKLLGIDQRRFHTVIKPLIKRDFRNELEKKNITNPDIALDANNELFLVHPKEKKNYIKTNTKLNSYKQ